MEKLHIIPHHHTLTRLDREQLHGHKGKVIWFVGLSGSGKSTLANQLAIDLHNEGLSTYILDGDNIRAGLNKGLTFTETDRKENLRRIAEVAKLMLDAGLIVITAFITPFEADRATIKSMFEPNDFVEIYVECSIEVCEARDVKGLYAKARKGEIQHFTGINSPFEVPQAPSLIVSTHKLSLEESTFKINEFLKNKMKI